MALTITLQTPTDEAYDLTLRRIPAAGLALFEPVGPTVKNGNVSTQDYTYSGGDAADTLGLQARQSYDPKNDRTSNSLKLSALVKTTSTLSDEVEYDLITATVAWDVPGQFSPDADFTVDMVSYVVAIFAQELTGANGTPTSKVVDQFDHHILSMVAG